MRGRAKAYVAMWLLALGAGQAAAFLMVWRFFVDSARGQRFDTIALAGNSIGRSHVETLVNSVLDAMSVLSVLAAIAVIGFIALVRGRVALAALATVLIVGANATTQVLKYVLERPDLGVDVARAAAGNSLPSGHTTVAASVAVALVLVLPSPIRGAAALAGAGYAALAGVATLSAGWHRPSDGVAAYLVVGAWAAAVGLALILLDKGGEAAPQPHRVALLTLFVAGFVLLVVAVAGLGVTSEVLSTPPEWLSRRRLFAAYSGGAAGIAGSASVMMALVLVAVHRVVPDRAARTPHGALMLAAS